MFYYRVGNMRRYRVHYHSSLNIDNLYDWCVENCLAHFFPVPMQLFIDFENSDDAVNFAKRWKHVV